MPLRWLQSTCPAFSLTTPLYILSASPKQTTHHFPQCSEVVFTYAFAQADLLAETFPPAFLPLYLPAQTFPVLQSSISNAASPWSFSQNALLPPPPRSEMFLLDFPLQSVCPPLQYWIQPRVASESLGHLTPSPTTTEATRGQGQFAFISNPENANIWQTL